MIEVVPATVEHARAMAPNLRAADLAEVVALTNMPVAEVLIESVAMSNHAFTVLEDGEPIAMAGVGPWESVLSGIGHAWMLGTDGVTRNKKRLLRESRARMPELMEGYGSIRNVVDGRYEASLRWLRWLGFSVSEEKHHNGTPYHVVELSRP
jgi:hypothetical protein